MTAVAVTTLKPDVFVALRTLILANKPTYTYNSTTFTYTLEAAFPNENPTFPLIVLNESAVKLSLINMDGSGEDYMVEIPLDFYAKEQHGQKAIGSAQSQLMNTFVGNITNFINNDGLVPMEDFWEDSNIDSYQERNQVLNTGSSILRFKLR